MQDEEPRKEAEVPGVEDGNDTHEDADMEADIEVVKPTAPEAEPAAETEAAHSHAELPSPVKLNPKERLAGELA